MENEIGGSSSVEEMQGEEPSGVVSEHSDTVSDLTSYCAKWILKTSETRKLTRTALVGIVEDTADLIKEVLSSAKSQILHSLRDNELNTSCIMKVFSDDNESLKSFDTLLTFQQQVKYYRELLIL